MAAAPHEKDSSGTVVVGALRIGTRVKAEPETKAMALDTLTKRKGLKKHMRERQDAEDDVIEAEGILSAAMRRTERQMKIFAQRLASAHVTPRQKGEKSAPFTFVFNNKNPSQALPGARDERIGELKKIKARIADTKKAGAEAPKLGAEFLKSVDQELAAYDQVIAREKELAEARAAEETAKRATVVAVRAMANEVQAKFAEEPAIAREVLGYGNPAATRRKNLASQKKAALSATAVEE